MKTAMGNGILPSRLETHAPFDLIAIMLGTNDLRARLNRSATDIAQSAALLGQTAARSVCGIGGKPPAVLLIAPPPVIVLPGWDELLAGGEEKSAEFGKRYAWFADRYGLHFMDAGAAITLESGGWHSLRCGKSPAPRGSGGQPDSRTPGTSRLSPPGWTFTGGRLL